jgi:hypothetical protein
MPRDPDATDHLLVPTPVRSRPTPRCARLIAALILASAVFLSAQLQAAVEIPPMVTAYSSALADLQKGAGDQTVESVFEQGMKASPTLQGVLRDLSETQYQQAQGLMQGFIVERHETIFVRPIVGYFKELAKKSGSKADQAFFDIYERTEPDGQSPFPAYSEQQTDEAGCTRFDNGKFIDLYRGWTTFRTAYPDNYATEAQGEIDSIESELQSGICSCTDASSTAAGLQNFVKAFPNLPFTPKLKERIAQIKSGKSKFRFHCHGG